MFAGTHDNKGTQHLLYPKDEEETKVDIEEVDEALRTNIFNVMLGRRSQRKFDETRLVEDSKVEMIFAAADTAPTAGGFQGFEVFNVKKPDVKVKLVDAANKRALCQCSSCSCILHEPRQSKDELSPRYS